MTEISLPTRKLLALSMLRGVGPATLRKIAQVPHFEELPIADFREYLPKNVVASLGTATIADATADADRQVNLALKIDARIISAIDPEYPRLLAQTRDDPQILFVKGQLASSPNKSVAIIGTREPTEHGKIIAKRLTGFFVEDGWSVVSGLALGCDGIAHEVAVGTGGHTVAVLAHGLQTISPKSHTKLAEQILESGGALVTEYRMGQEALPAQFVKRDRTQAGLAQGVVMIQSDIKGGSLFASRAAIEYQRWLSVPYPTDQDVSRREPKVEANLLLADGTPDEKAELLKCKTSDLQRLIVLRGKSDYAQLIGLQEPSLPPVTTPAAQLQLF